MALFLMTGPKRRMIQAWRGASKSWITCAYVCWRLYLNPQANILVISASKAKADDFTSFVKRLITDVECLRHLKARGDQRWSAVCFDVSPAEADPNPSVKSVGITGQMTGSRADEVIFDDVEVPENSATQMMREKLAEKVKEAAALLKPEGESRITYLGTPQTESSIYNQLPGRGYSVRIWPVRYPDAKQREEYGEKLAPDIIEDLDADPSLVGKSVEPSRFTEMDLVERMVEYGVAGFQLQFMLNTRLSDADKYPLKLADLVFANLDVDHGPERVVWAASPELVMADLPNVGLQGDRLYRPVALPGVNYLPYTGRVLAIDPSGRGKDETSYAVVFILHSQLFLMDAGGFRDGYSPGTLEALAKIAQRWKVNKVINEPNFGDGMFTQLFKPVLNRFWPCACEESERAMTQKEKRICDTLEPVTQSHRLVVNAALVRKDFDSTAHLPAEIAQRYQLFYQLTRITREKGALAQDDRIEAVAIAVAYWTAQLSQDVNRAVDNAREAARQKELKKFMAHALGRKLDGPVWATR